MNASTRGLARTTMVAVATLLFPAMGYAYSHNEHQTNNTGATAYDVVKILEGDYQISDMMEWDFAQHDYYHRTVNGKVQTVLRWWDGAVPAGSAGDVCFTATALGNSASYAKIIGAWWTDENGVPQGDYYPAVSMSVNFDDPNNPLVAIGNHQAGNINVAVDDNGMPLNPNFWQEGDFALGGAANPLQVFGVKAAIVDVAMTPQNLFVENTIFDNGPDGMADSFFDIFTEIVIDPEQELDAFLGRPVAPGQSVVLVADLGDGNYDLFNFENRIPEPTTAVLCGLGFLGILLLRKRN